MRYINLAEANAIWFSLDLAINSVETKAWFENYKNHKSIYMPIATIPN